VDLPNDAEVVVRCHAAYAVAIVQVRRLDDQCDCRRLLLDTRTCGCFARLIALSTPVPCQRNQRRPRVVWLHRNDLTDAQRRRLLLPESELG